MILRRRILQGAGLLALAGTVPRRPAAAAPTRDDGGPYAWRSVPFGGGGFVDGFLYHPREKGLLYTRTDIGGAYRFEAATGSWVPLLDHLSHDDADLMGVLSLAVDPRDPDRLYAACGLYLDSWQQEGALLASTDRGATWRATPLHLKLGGNSAGRGTGERLQVDPNLGDVLLLGTSQDGLLRSADRGRTFEKLPFAPRHVSLVLFDPGSGAPGTASRIVRVGSHDQPGLYVSRDGGRSFEREPGTPEQVPQHAVHAADGTLYVTFARGPAAFATNPGNAKTGGVWKRDPAGRWSDISPVKPGSGGVDFGYSGLDVDRQAPGRLVVSTIERFRGGDDIFLSADGGAHWTALGARSRHDARPWPWLVNYTRGEDRMGHWIADVRIDPFDGDRAIYGTGYGVWTTRNLGAALTGGTVEWDFTVSNLEETATLEIRSPSGGATLLGAMGDVGGSAWDDTGRTPPVGLFTPTFETNRSVDFAQSSPGIIARTADPGTGGYWSTDGAATWHPFGPSPHVPNQDSGVVAVSAAGNFFVWAPDRRPALWSRDHGRTWQPSEGWPAARDVTLVPVADRSLDGVFYVHDPAAGQVLVSADGGRSFKPAITGLPALAAWQQAQLVCAPGKVRDLWLAMPGGLLHLPGLDEAAKTIRPVAEAWKVALGKAAPGAAYHAVYVWGRVAAGGAPASAGLFRSDDAGASFVRIDDERHRYGRLLSMTADPLEYGTVYLAPHGRGIVVGKPRTAKPA